MTLAPMFATYRAPRDSSSAMSEAEPPIATTEPKTGAPAGAAETGTASSAKAKKHFAEFTDSVEAR
jgi:hypothetical protein